MILYCLVGVAAFLLYISVVSYAIATVVNRKGHDPSASSISSALLLGHVGISWLSMLVMGYAQIRHWTKVLWPLRGAQPLNQAPAKAVVFVHGAYHNASAWHFIKPVVLRRLGGARDYCFCYRVGKKNLEDLALELDLFLRQCVKDSGTSELLLIGHSLGGLIARYYRSTMASRQVEENNTPKLEGVITLSTPHAGTLFAKCGLDPLSRSLYPGSPVFRSLEARERELATQPAPPTNGHALHPFLDNMVIPARCLRVNSPGWRSKELPGLSHLALLWHPAALRAVCDALADMSRTMPPCP